MRYLNFIGCFALASSAAAQTTWHVDAHATPPGSGTLAAPYQSLQYAHDQPTTLAGDIVLAAPGTYAERVHMTKSIVMRSSSGPLATVIKPPTDGYTVFLDGSFLTPLGAVFEGFTLIKTGVGHVTAAAQATNGKLRHCIVLGNGTGFGVLSQWGLAIEHCTLIGNRIGLVESVPDGRVYGDSVLAYGSVESDAALFTNNTINSCFGSATLGSGSSAIFGDPLLFDLAGRDVHLRVGSPCINAGTPTPPGDPFGPHDEIGALAFDPSYAPFKTYCTAKTNSLGCVPTVGASGTPSLSSGLPFTITCSNELSHKPGLLFYGFAPNSAVFQGGFLCVQAPLRRVLPSSAGGTPGVIDCSGVYSYDFNALIPSDAAIEPSVEVFAQFWSRDPQASFSTNISDAIRFHVLP
jgi:hypothetical protein